ncbi:MAG: hypothetical protein AAB433_05910, partial [Nitrospirota bacterium]
MLKFAVMIQQITATFSRWICAAMLLAILATSTILEAPHAQANEPRWGFGSGLGLTSGTVNGT